MIIFPAKIEQLLRNDKLAPFVRQMADTVEIILHDNKTKFFPHYTDHGVDHVNKVLENAVELVVDEVWNETDHKLLSAIDAAVLVGGVLLHDIGMHIHPKGFLELVTSERFQPLVWFNEDHEGHPADLPWALLWQNYVEETRRFSEEEWKKILGAVSFQAELLAKLPASTEEWTEAHYLAIGEFIRRHHARLAHEIAIYGFPGTDSILIGGSLCGYADLIGLTARSHWMSLRICGAYLEESPNYTGAQKPRGCAAIYVMSLLRLADSLQIDNSRAPSILLHLKSPHSQISLLEWEKHRVITYVGNGNDPNAVSIEVSQDIKWEVYLQISDLIGAIQREMDHATAVLGEVYGSRKDLGALQVKKRRVETNIHKPYFYNVLPYVPEPTGFSCDTRLLALLVTPLYGDHPEIAIRELLQNSVDAVREREAWTKRYSKCLKPWHSEEEDILVEFIRSEDQKWIVRVKDQGIGMQISTLKNYFLRAGASFRDSAVWSRDFTDANGKPVIVRGGRFGIGAFAISLLGPTFTLRTRHVSDASNGYEITASTSATAVEIRRANSPLPIGTTIEVEIVSQRSEQHEEPSWFRKTDWYCWAFPRITRKVVSRASSNLFPQRYVVPGVEHCFEAQPEWSKLSPLGYEAVYWTFLDSPKLICNGIKVGSDPVGPQYEWNNHTFRQPSLSIVDPEARLPLKIQRDGLARTKLDFEEVLLRDIYASFIAYALVCGPTSFKEAVENHQRYPLLHNSDQRRQDLRWISSKSGFVPADPLLFSFLGCQNLLLFGHLKLILDLAEANRYSFKPNPADLLEKAGMLDGAFATSDSVVEDLDARHTARWGAAAILKEAMRTIEKIPRSGVGGIGGKDFYLIFSDLETNWKRKSTSCAPPDVPLNALMQEWVGHFSDGSIGRHVRSKRGGNIPFLLYLRPSPDHEPSTLAALWIRCLGKTYIPYDKDERTRLVREGSQHAELASHVQKWKKLHDMRSPWVDVKRMAEDREGRRKEMMQSFAPWKKA